MKHKSDGELVALARAGQKRAFGHLIERYLQLARRVAAERVTHDDVAQELAQEALLQAYLSLDHLREPERFKSWLCGIVLNVCRSHLRERAARWTTDRGEYLLLPDADPQVMAEEQERQRIVREAVEALSPENRAAIQHFYYEQRSVLEVAAHLHISQAAVKGRLHKARKQLRELLIARDPEIGEAALPKKPRRKRMVQTTVTGVYVQQRGKGLSYFLLLTDAKDRRLRIFVGQAEAWSINSGLAKPSTDRPMTLDFMANLLRETGASLQEVRIEEIKAETFYAVVKLHIGGKAREMDARPSDAIALASRMESPIFVAEGIMQKAAERRDDPVYGEPLSILAIEDAVGMAHALIKQALQDQAREITFGFGPGQAGIHVLTRVNNDWEDKMTLPQSSFQVLAARLKMMAEMDIGTHELPQEGLIPVRYDGKDYALRVFTLPGTHGETLTITITDKSSTTPNPPDAPPAFRHAGIAFRKEGTLRVVPEGWGYLGRPQITPAADEVTDGQEVYVSTGQIEQFGLKAGDVIAGWIRPPQEDERFMSLLWVEAINGKAP